MDATFIINRISRMSAFEMAYRARQIVRQQYEKEMRKKMMFHAPERECGYELFSDKKVYSDITKLISSAEKISKDCIDIFSVKSYCLGPEINYHKDCKSGLEAPDNTFCKAIDYRDSSKIGDIKYIWEPNRHLFLVPLSFAFHFTKEERYLKKFEYYLSQWFEQNPFLSGVNWSSSLELGIRLVNWTLCWHLVNESVNEELKQKWIQSIYQHCWFIERNFSRYSSANNHLIGEAAGLFIASTALPRFKDSKKWQSKAFNIMVQECEKQNYKDGVNKEQALSYQQFVLDFLILSGLVGKRYNKPFPASYWKQIEKMLEYLAAIKDVKGNYPQTGDEDDGFVVDMGQREYGVYKSLLNTGAYLFGRRDFLCISEDLDDKTKILLNMAGIDPAAKPERTGNTLNRFDEGGYYILGSNLGEKNEQKLIFDCGPLGYLSLAAHGHADALSFFFSAGGCPVFIDPGTYAYHGNKVWRNYFRSTAAHNTVCIDGQDQSVIAGNFMWSRKARAQLIHYSGYTSVRGTHDGYLRLKDKVRHYREVKYRKENDRWEITDEVSCRGKHDMAIYFHLHPQCSVSREEDRIKIHFGKGVCELWPEPGLKVSIHTGEEEPILGWYSPSYDIKLPANTIKLSKSIGGSTKIKTTFTVRYE